MAYTKILVIHNRLDKCVSYVQNEEKTSLEAAIDYAMNRDKTESTCFETAINCDRETVYRDMVDTKRRWGKADRIRKGYHIIQSFPPGEVTPDEAHALGVELAERLLGGQYEVIVTTHLDKAHLHNHLIFNSVSFTDGTMYRDQFKDYFGGDGVGIRGTSDAICREHGLSIIEPDATGPSVDRAEWTAEQKGKPTLRGLVRQDIDEALAGAYTLRSFWQRLESMGYAVKRGPNVAHTAVRPPWGKRNIRLDSLGAGYTEADIQARLAAARSGENPSPPASTQPYAPMTSPLLTPGRRYRVHGGAKTHRPRKLSGFRALYFKYLYLLGAAPTRRPRNRAAFSVRDEVIRFDRYQEQFSYLNRNRIETAGQLAMQYDALQAEIDALTGQRRELYGIRRAGHGGETVTDEIAAITSRLRALRRELKLCVRIEGDIPRIRETVQTQKHQRSKSHEKADESRPNRYSKSDPRVSAGDSRTH